MYKLNRLRHFLSYNIKKLVRTKLTMDFPKIYLTTTHYNDIFFATTFAKTDIILEVNKITLFYLTWMVIKLEFMTESVS